jgi:hypothetical protein
MRGPEAVREPDRGAYAKCAPLARLNGAQGPVRRRKRCRMSSTQRSPSKPDCCRRTHYLHRCCPIRNSRNWQFITRPTRPGVEFQCRPGRDRHLSAPGEGQRRGGRGGACVAGEHLRSSGFQFVRFFNQHGFHRWFPVSYRLGSFSACAQIYHQRSYLSDEFLIGHPGVDHINLSYEDSEAVLAYEFFGFRLYGSGGYILRSEPDLAPTHGQVGLEFRWPRLFADLHVLAVGDFQAYEALDWAVDSSLHAFGFVRRSAQGARSARSWSISTASRPVTSFIISGCNIQASVCS